MSISVGKTHAHSRHGSGKGRCKERCLFRALVCTLRNVWDDGSVISTYPHRNVYDTKRVPAKDIGAVLRVKSRLEFVRLSLT